MFRTARPHLVEWQTGIYQGAGWHAQSDSAIAMGVGTVANVSSDSPRPSYLRACHPIPQSVPPHLQVDFKMPLALVRLGEDGLGRRRLAGYKTSPFPWDRIQRDTADSHFEFVE